MRLSGDDSPKVWVACDANEADGIGEDLIVECLTFEILNGKRGAKLG